MSSGHGTQSHEGGTTWGKLLILPIWKYATTIWKNRNGHIYGIDEADTKHKTKEQLQAQVHEAYAAYAADLFYVSPQHSSHWGTKFLTVILNMGFIKVLYLDVALW